MKTQTLFEPLHYLIISAIIILILFGVIYKILEALGKNPGNILPLNFAKRVRWPLLLLLIAIFVHTVNLALLRSAHFASILSHVATIVIIGSVAWVIIILLHILKKHLLAKYDVTQADNLKARKIYTQYVILENTIIFIVIVLALGIALMSFSSIRNVGISVLTSAGIAGLIIGFAAQKALGTILAGIQIALTQPIRFDDVVIIEGEWGWIEEITLTYIVVRVWDKRRLIVPTTYFIENTFQNWTRTQADILGTVFIYTDYTLPMEPLREELTRLLNESPYWDGDVNVLQVTNATDSSVEIRALMSARNSPDAWELRVFVREKLIAFIQEKYPRSLPKIRIESPFGD